MSTQDTILTYYESIQRVANIMVEAARASDWDTLIEAEQCCAQLIKHLQETDRGEPLDQPAARRKFEIIRQVLAYDAEIRNLTQPWLTTLETLLGQANTSRKMREAYQ